MKDKETENIQKIILDPLNSRQREAVLATEGPVLIIAGAGSGKTKALTHRVAYLLSRGVHPENILAVTFTNKAAREMKDRITLLVERNRPRGAGDPFIGTFHSFCVRILRSEAMYIGYTRSFTIFDDDDSISLIKEILKEVNVNPKQFPAAMVLGIISGLKSELIESSGYEGRDSSEMFPKIIYRVFDLYEKRLKNSNAMDFDDLITKTVLLFRGHPDILEKYQSRFRYIHIDEYQDTNTAQYELSKLLAARYKNIFVIGDDAQSIYSWRNADFRNILNFEKDFPDSRVIVLDENYRSTKTILEGANAVISQNTLQKQKKLWTQKPDGEKIEYVILPTELSEAEFVASEIERLSKAGKELEDIAVLYRTNAQSRAVEEILLSKKIPYSLIGGIKFYRRKEIKDITSYLRLIANPNDQLALRRVINVPPRGIGKITLLKFLGSRERISTGERPKSGQEATSVGVFENILSDLRGSALILPPHLLVREIVKKISYEEYLEDAFLDSEMRIENIREFEALASRFSEGSPSEELIRMLEEISLVQDADTARETGKKGVTLMTLHAAKGLEFPVVFITGMEEGIFPHSKSLFDPGSLEEERRLCYVGLTRAKEKVWLLRAYRRRVWGDHQINSPSRFVKEIPEHLLNVTDAAGDMDFFKDDEIEYEDDETPLE